MAISAVNAGYTFTKWRFKDRIGLLPSVRGPADRDLFSMDGTKSNRIALAAMEGDRPTDEIWFVGQEAVDQSLTVSRRENRDWIYSSEYHMLWHAAFSEMTAQFRTVDLQVMTGLPVNYYRDQREDLENWVKGIHKVKRVGRQIQTFNVLEAMAVPELMGILFCMCITPDGKLLDNHISLGRAGVLDIGGHNTGFLVSDKLKPIRRQCRSIDMGCWKAVEIVSARIDELYPGLGLRDHEVIDCMVRRQVGWRGRLYDIGGIVDAAMAPVLEAILGTMSRLYDQRLDVIILGGGGAHLGAEAVRQAFPQPDYAEWYVQVVGDPVGTKDPDGEKVAECASLAAGVDPIFGNVEGMYRYGLYRWG